MELADGFLFLPVYATNPGVEERVGELLSAWGAENGIRIVGFPISDPPEEGPVVTALLRCVRSAPASCVLWFPLGRRLQRAGRLVEGVDEVYGFFRGLNQRRDQVARAAGAPVVLAMHGEDWRDFRLQARDFWSIRQGEWRFDDVSDAERAVSARLPRDSTSEAAADLRRGWRSARGGSQSPGRPGRIEAAPAPPPGFVGRERLVHELRRTLLQGGEPVVLVGMIGVGKTSLALKVGQELSQEFVDGVLLLHADGRGREGSDWLARRLVDHFLPGLPESASPEQARATARALLHDRRALIILDDFDNPATLADLIDDGGRSRFLATSRAIVSGRGLKVFQIDGLRGSEARALLEARVASSAGPDMIRWMLASAAGHPLSLRLLAGLVDSKPDLLAGRSPEEAGWTSTEMALAQVLGAVLDLAAEGHRRVLLAASMFDLPADPKLIARVAEVSLLEVVDALETLDGLTIETGARWRVHPAIRALLRQLPRTEEGERFANRAAAIILAEDQAEGAHEDEPRLQVARILDQRRGARTGWVDDLVLELGWCVFERRWIDELEGGRARWARLVQQVGRARGLVGVEALGVLFADGEVESAALLEFLNRGGWTDLDTAGHALAAAFEEGGGDLVERGRVARLERAHQGGDTEETVSAAIDLAGWYLERGRAEEARVVLGPGLEVEHGAVSPQLRSLLWAARAEAWAALGRRAEVAMARQKALDSALEEGEPAVVATAQERLGSALISVGRLDEGLQLVSAARDGYDRLGLPSDAARATTALGQVHLRVGNFERARLLLDDSRRQHQRLGDLLGTAEAELDLGQVARIVGDYSAAESHLRSALSGFRETGQLLWVSMASVSLAQTLQVLDRLEEAEGFARSGLEAAEAAGWGAGQVDTRLTWGWLSLDGGHLATARDLAVSAQRIASEIPDPQRQAAATDLEAVVAIGGEDWPSALDAARRALGLRLRAGLDGPGAAQALAMLATIHRALGNEPLAAALEGRANEEGAASDPLVQAELRAAIESL